MFRPFAFSHKLFRNPKFDFVFTLGITSIISHFGFSASVSDISVLQTMFLGMLPVRSSYKLELVILCVVFLNLLFTVKILKFGTPQTIAIIVLKIERFDVTLH